MNQARLFKMQQDQYDQATHLKAQVADLTATFLFKRVRPSAVGMLTAKRGNQTGVVSDILVGPQIAGLEIAWEDGSESQSLPYMVEVVED